MKWIFKTYTAGVYGPSLFECDADDIVAADEIYQT